MSEHDDETRTNGAMNVVMKSILVAIAIWAFLSLPFFADFVV